MRPTEVKLQMEPVLLIATIVAWIHHHSKCGITPTIIAWAQSKTLMFLMQRLLLYVKIVTPVIGPVCLAMSEAA